MSNNQSRQSDDDLIKRFRNHMFQGNINQALRLLDKTSNKGILPINDETIKQLHEKHPVGEQLHQEMLLNGPVKDIHPIIFEDLNSELVRKVAVKIMGVKKVKKLKISVREMQKVPVKGCNVIVPTRRTPMQNLTLS